MISFLPIAILAYAFNAGSIIIDKILLRKNIPNPVVYAFFISVLGMLVIVFAPFGLQFSLQPTFLSVLSGIFGVLALLTFFQSLKSNEASVVGPLVGALNPLFALFLGGLFLNQLLTLTQFIAFFMLILGAAILTLNMWLTKLRPNKNLLFITLAGFLFAVSYVLLREAFLQSNFVSGLVISRFAGGLFALSFLAIPNLRRQIFSFKSDKPNLKQTAILLVIGQTMGALFGLLITAAVYLVSPALVNSLFGVQYLVILIAALMLSKKHPQLLDEDLSRKTLTQKIIGAIILSFGVYLLSL